MRESTFMPLTKQPKIDDQFLKVGLKAITEADKVIQKYFQQDIQIEIKETNSPVTIADQEAEQIIRQVISAEFPDHGFLGEEGGATNPDAEYTWIIDPIDGTKSFIRSLPDFGTFLALAHRDQLLMGISYLPMFKWLAYAVKGKGAFYNHQPMVLSEETNIDEAYITTAGLKYFARTNKYQQLVKLSETVRHLRSYPEAQGWHLVFQGKLDAQIEAQGFPWDFAAHAMITQEAGGIVTQIDGSPYTLASKTILAVSNQQLHTKLVNIFK